MTPLSIASSSGKCSAESDDVRLRKRWTYERTSLHVQMAERLSINSFLVTNIYFDSRGSENSYANNNIRYWTNTKYRFQSSPSKSEVSPRKWRQRDYCWQIHLPAAFVLTRAYRTSRRTVLSYFHIIITIVKLGETRWLFHALGTNINWTSSMVFITPLRSCYESRDKLICTDVKDVRMITQLLVLNSMNWRWHASTTAFLTKPSRLYSVRTSWSDTRGVLSCRSRSRIGSAVAEWKG
jgi:hypothetical protein